MRSPAPLLILVLTGGLVAQQTTSPRGYLNKPGGSVASLGVTDLFSTLYTEQLVQIDDTQKGRAQTIRALHLRRSASAYDFPLSKANTLDFMARMAHGDYSKVTGRAQTLATLLVGSWVDVFPAKKVSFPDMSKRPTKSPAPWTLKIPLAKPFPYDGKNALVLQMHAWAGKATGSYPFDAINENFTITWGDPVGRGRGCKHGPHEMEAWAGFTVFAGNTPSQLIIDTFPQVTSVAHHTTAVIGLKNPNLTLPGVCAPLLASFDIVTTMFSWVIRQDGVQGWYEAIPFPHAANLVGIELFVQTWAPDPTQKHALKVAGSSGWRTGKYPPKPVPTTPVALYRHTGQELGTFVNRVAMMKSAGVIVGFER